MRCLTSLVAILFVLTMTAAGWAGSAIPDLKGTWVVKASGSGHIKPSKSPPAEVQRMKPGFHELNFLMVIDQQDGFRFSGYRQPGTGKKIVSGVIGYDNQTVYMVDSIEYSGGMIIGKIVSPDKIECIYLEAGKHFSVASREIMTRKR